MARILPFLALIASAYADKGFNLPSSSYGAPEIRNEASNIVTSYNPSDLRAEVEDPIAVLASIIPGGGVPGEDYPIFAVVRDTGFACGDMEYPGYYADINTGCQVFHICQPDFHQDSFLCPNGTVFNQQYFVCDWWFNVDCSSSSGFFRLNDDIGKVPEDDILRDSSASGLSNSYSAPPSDPIPPVPRQYGAPVEAVPLPEIVNPLDTGAPSNQYAVPLDAGSPVPLPEIVNPLDTGAPAPPPSNQYAVPLDAGNPVPLPSNLYNFPNRRRSFN